MNTEHNLHKQTKGQRYCVKPPLCGRCLIMWYVILLIYLLTYHCAMTDTGFSQPRRGLQCDWYRPQQAELLLHSHLKSSSNIQLTCRSISQTTAPFLPTYQTSSLSVKLMWSQVQYDYDTSLTRLRWPMTLWSQVLWYRMSPGGCRPNQLCWIFCRSIQGHWFCGGWYLPIPIGIQGRR